MSEREFQAQVVELARTCGWRHFHVSDSRKVVGGRLVGDPSIAGFPDLVLIHGNRGVVFAELKDTKTRLKPHQRAVLDDMAAAAVACTKVRVHLWRPDDMVPVIVPLLRDGRGPTIHGW